jgi:uncharacterized protein (DUF2236 family)
MTLSHGTLSATSTTLAPADGQASGAEPLGPGSLIWRLGMPRTALLLAGRALFLQTMHPVIGAGVRDFSNYREDPWGRLDRTLRSLQRQLYGGVDSVDEAVRLREMHKRFRGIGFSGERYRALDPSAYAWVHLSNCDTILSFHRWFGRPLPRHEQEQVYAEWCQVGRVLGIKAKDMPADLAGFGAYVKDMVATTLQDNDTARQLLGTLELSDLGPPPWRAFPEPLWRSLRPAGRMLLHDVTVGTLPADLRAKLDLKWTSADQKRLQALALVVRTASATTPARLLQYPEGYRAQTAARAQRRRHAT